jgi:hypothetical protein
MSDAKPSPVAIDNEFGKFPSYMHLVHNVFEFSHAEASKVTKRFQNNSDLLTMLGQMKEVVLSSDLSDASKESLAKLIEEESDVISFSASSRSSVITI